MTDRPATERLRRLIHAVATDQDIYESEQELREIVDAALSEAAQGAAPRTEGLDVERLGFADLLDVADAILRKYPPDTIVCSHHVRADRGAKTTAAIADLIASARLSRPSDDPEEEQG